MPQFKPGELVVLKSGGPTMTVDAVNTDIFDDNKITGIVCVWFVGEKLERVRFDYRAIEHAQNAHNTFEAPLEATGEYELLLDGMVDALNQSAEDNYSRSNGGTQRRRTARARDNQVLLATKASPD